MKIIYMHVHIYLYMYTFVQGNVYKEGSREKKKEKKEGRKEGRKEGTHLNFPMRVARFFEIAPLAVSSPPEHWSWSCSTRAFFEKKLSAGTESELRRALQQHAHNDCHCTAADAVAKDGSQRRLGARVVWFTSLP